VNRSRLVLPLVLAALPAMQPGQSRTGGATDAHYDGDFTFARVRYGGGGFRRGGGAWAHDYPRADHHLPQILQYVSTAPTNVGRSHVFDLDDPEIFRHPILYLSEPGFWSLGEAEAAALREWLLKGGFLILDDFENDQWYNMEAQLRRAMPELELMEIGPEHPVFHAFFELDDIYVPHPLVRVTPRYYGLFENNDPAGRMLVLVNFNADLAEYWEWSAEGLLPVDLSDEAYKLGVNYLIYGLTH
jgi:hypothetical protein